MAAIEEEKSLTEIFQDVVDHTYTLTTPDSITASVAMLISNFSIAYKIAGNDEKTKKALTESLTDFAVNTAGRVPKNADGARLIAGAVIDACDTLVEIVKDKSLIPADFYTQLLKAAQQLAHMKGGPEAMNACTEASKAISATADQFCTTPASASAAPVQFSTSLDSVGRRGKIGQQP